MKFKLIFILFNVVILLSFLIIYFMPVMTLGWDYFATLWQQNWYLPVVFLAIVGVLNAYFLRNWKLFQLLEQEDWDRLLEYLEEQVYTKLRCRNQYVKLMINAYLVKSSTDKIRDLEEHLKVEKPELIKKNALLFGIPYLLENNPEGMETYFKPLLKIKSRESLWFSWCYGFALALLKKSGECADILVPLCQKGKEPVLLLLTAYLLDSSGGDIGKKQAEELSAELKKKYSRSAWDREVERSKTNVLVVILTRMVDEAVTWLHK